MMDKKQWRPLRPEEYPPNGDFHNRQLEELIRRGDVVVTGGCASSCGMPA